MGTKGWSKIFKKEIKFKFNCLLAADTLCAHAFKWTYALFLIICTSNLRQYFPPAGPLGYFWQRAPCFLSGLWGGGRTAGIGPRCKTPQSEINFCLSGKSQGSRCLTLGLPLSLRGREEGDESVRGKKVLWRNLLLTRSKKVEGLNPGGRWRFCGVWMSFPCVCVGFRFPPRVQNTCI